MTITKFLALSTIFAVHTMNARVQLNSAIEIYYPKEKIVESLFLETELELREPALIYSSDMLRIEAQVKPAQENQALIEYKAFCPNDQGVFELVKNPALLVTYGNTGYISLGAVDAEGNALEGFSVIAELTKIS